MKKQGIATADRCSSRCVSIVIANNPSTGVTPGRPARLRGLELWRRPSSNPATPGCVLPHVGKREGAIISRTLIRPRFARPPSPTSGRKSAALFF